MFFCYQSIDSWLKKFAGVTICLLPGIAPFTLASDYGTKGLIDTPTARMRADGALSITAAKDRRYRQTAISYQITPWLEGTFRYSGFESNRWDRNYEVKVRLLQETDDGLPAIAIGARDIVGTGRFGSEYLVASKRFGRLDASLGLGWGRLADRGVATNPFSLISDRFRTRTRGLDSGGKLLTDTYFSGPTVGVFGGLNYYIPGQPAILQLEYNPDRYRDGDWGEIPPESPFSLGLVWRLSTNTQVALSAQHSDELGMRVTHVFDSVSDPPPEAPEPFISSYFLSQNAFPPGYRKSRWFDRLVFDAERSGLLVIEGNLSRDASEVQLVVGNLEFQLWSDAIDQHIALADLHLPLTVKKLYLVIEEEGHRVATVVTPRPSHPDAIDASKRYSRTRIVSGRTLERPASRTSFVTKRINTSASLRTRFQLFDPDDPARYQLYVGIDSDYVLSNHWSIRSSISLNLEHNFDESKRRESNSRLSPVRTDIVRYLDDGATRLDSLLIEGRDTYKSNLHYRVFGGLLEQMYAGVGGEVLYWPTQSRLAVGASVAYAKKRNYEGQFGLLDYEVITGFVSAYYASDFHNLDFALHAGRYLAKDVGATLEVRRTFANGWQVGLWASLTDVPFDVFGEGSFDKGMYFQIPLSSLFGAPPSRARFSTALRPIQRDGGQRLNGYGGEIFWDVRAARYDALSHSRD